MFPVVRSVINSLRTDTYQTRPGWQIICRLCSGTTQQQTEGEQRIQSLLKAKFPKATDVQVADISGGCGSMYEILLESEEFKGHRTIAQHRMVNEALKHELEDMHGLRISTRVPKDS